MNSHLILRKYYLYGYKQHYVGRASNIFWEVLKYGSKILLENSCNENLLEVTQ